MNYVGPGPRPPIFFPGIRAVHVGFGPGGFFVGFLLLLVLVVLVAVVLSLFMSRRHLWRHYAGDSPWRPAGSSEAMRILNERFAKGEIDAEEYKVRKELLLESSPK